MTDGDLTDLYATVRDNCPNPLIKAMVDILHRDHLAERAMGRNDRHVQERIDAIYGHPVYWDNDRHSRRAPDLRAV